MTVSGRREYTLAQIAAELGGEVLGDPKVRVSQVASLAHAAPGDIAFLANERYRRELQSTRAGAVIIGEGMRDATPMPRIVSANPYAYFARVSALFNPLPPPAPGIHPAAVVDASAVIAPSAEIAPLAVIGRNVRIGEGAAVGPGCILGEGVELGPGARLYGNVTVYAGCIIGARTLVHSGAVIGADGFGLAPDDGRWLKVPQIGRVVIGDDVEIGANTTIDRGALDDTVIEDGVKLDNQIQIGHNVHVGAHTAIAACAGVAGSARIGRGCRIGGASGIAGHITIADNVEISAHTLIAKSIDKPGTYTGAYPFEANREWRRNAVQLRHLGELAERMRTLEQALATSKRSKT